MPDKSDSSSSSPNSSGSSQPQSLITWIGRVESPEDCLLLIEACRLNRLTRVPQRLSTRERNQYIKHGSIFVYDEEESGMQRYVYLLFPLNTFFYDCTLVISIYCFFFFFG